MTADTGDDKAERMRRPTISDVSRCYRLLLGRDVENVTVAGGQILASSTVAALYERIWMSQEAFNHRLGEAFAAAPDLLNRSVATAFASPEQLENIWSTTLDKWERRGFGSYDTWLRRNDPRYDDRSGKWIVEQTLALGEDEAFRLIEFCEVHGIPVRKEDGAAVLGSHAYRLGAALGSRTACYTHFEIASQDKETGKKALFNRGLRNFRSATVGELRGYHECFDLFYSVSALQYAPPPMMAEMLRLMIAALKPGGILVCQLPCQLHDYDFNLQTYISGEEIDPLGEIHSLPQREVLAIFEAEGAVPVGVLPDGRIGPLGLSFAFAARKRS